MAVLVLLALFAAAFVLMVALYELELGNGIFIAPFYGAFAAVMVWAQSAHIAGLI